MFNIDGKEFIMLVLVALVVLGPEKLPDLFRRVGKAYSEFRRLSDGFQDEFRKAIDEPAEHLRETTNTIRESATFSTTDVPVDNAPGGVSGGPHAAERGAETDTAPRDEAGSTAEAGTDQDEYIDPRVHDVVLPSFDNAQRDADEDRTDTSARRDIDDSPAIEPEDHPAEDEDPNANGDDR